MTSAKMVTGHHRAQPKKPIVGPRYVLLGCDTANEAVGHYSELASGFGRNETVH